MSSLVVEKMMLRHSNRLRDATLGTGFPKYLVYILSSLKSFDGPQVVF